MALTCRDGSCGGPSVLPPYPVPARSLFGDGASAGAWVVALMVPAAGVRGGREGPALGV